jgi:replicative DNA helicase
MKALAGQPKDLVGLPTGFQAYDHAIGGGLRGGTVNVVGARPKGGKSFFCLNIAHNLASYGVPVLYLDTELSHKVQMMRLAALVTGVEITQIETGKFAANPDEAKAVYAGQGHLDKLPLTHCSIAGQSIKPVLSIIRRWLTKRVGFTSAGTAKSCCVIYDYIKLMDAHDIKGNLAEFQLLGFLLTEMNNFALKYDLPIFATAQLNRAGGSQEDGSVLSQSDRILWLCSSFTILKRKSTEEANLDPLTNGDRKLVVTDTRYGAGLDVGDYINLQCDLSRARMTEGPRFSQVAAEGLLGNKQKVKTA